MNQCRDNNVFKQILNENDLFLKQYIIENKQDNSFMLTIWHKTCPMFRLLLVELF